MNIYVLSIIWLTFTTLFSVMSCLEWKKSKSGSKSLELIQSSTGGEVIILGVNFKTMLERFKNELNQSNKESHKIAATSYLLAALTALASFIISIINF